MPRDLPEPARAIAAAVAHGVKQEHLFFGTLVSAWARSRASRSDRNLDVPAPLIQGVRNSGCTELRLGELVQSLDRSRGESWN